MSLMYSINDVRTSKAIRVNLWNSTHIAELIVDNEDDFQ